MEISSVLTWITVATNVVFLASLVYAAWFAGKHKHVFKNQKEKLAWSLFIFKKNGYGPDLEKQRKRLAWTIAISGISFFLLAIWLQNT